MVPINNNTYYIKKIWKHFYHLEATWKWTINISEIVVYPLKTHQFFSVKVEGVIAFLATPWIFLLNRSTSWFVFSWNINSAVIKTFSKRKQKLSQYDSKQHTIFWHFWYQKQIYLIINWIRTHIKSTMSLQTRGWKSFIIKILKNIIVSVNFKNILKFKNI